MATRTVHAVCSHDCPDSCAVLVTVDELTGRATRVQGDGSHPVTRGFLCGKVAKYLDRVYSPDRLLYPMRRRRGVAKGPVQQSEINAVFERVSWDEALGEIAGKFQTISDEFGPESVLPYSYAGTIGQLGYGSMDRRFFHRLGASQLDRTICSSTGGAAFLAVYGVRMGPAPQDFAQARLIIAWGANIHGNNVHLWPFIEEARRKGAKLVVIDPYRTRTAALADWHIAINPGTDAALALAMMHVILRDGLENKEYIAANTLGIEQLREHMQGYSPEMAAAATGVAAEDIERLARMYAAAKPAAIRMNYGIQRQENGGAAARAVAMLPLLTGAWMHRGGGVVLSTSGAFPFNSKALQMPELMLASPLGREARVVNMSVLGESLTELGTRAGDGPPVKALFVYNCNPAAVSPNQTAVVRGLQREDLFTVVHEQFLTDTADYADILLPAPSFLEVKDVQGAYGHFFMQLSQPAIAPLGESQPNWWVFGQLAQRMGFTEACFRDTADELIDAALEGNAAGITRERLEREYSIDIAAKDALPFSEASWFRTASGRGEFYSQAMAEAGLDALPVFRAPVESRFGAGKEKFPLELLARKADNWMNSTFANIPTHQAMERRTRGVLEMHAEDAEARGIRDGEMVDVWNDRGNIQLCARVNGSVRPGVVAASLGWSKLTTDGKGVNALTSERLNDLAGGPTFYSTLVEARKAG
jgi:anaerobic selenocysteine-containing dehydrogenase